MQTVTSSLTLLGAPGNLLEIRSTLDGSEAFFDLAYPPHQIDRLPGLREINEYKRIKADPTRDITPRSFICGAKAAPSYHMAVEREADVEFSTLTRCRMVPSSMD